jgi:hypothetical protein
MDIILCQLNSCCNNPEFDVSKFFATHGIEDDVSLSREDVMAHFLNGQCATRKTPGCSEVVHVTQSPIKMALMVTEAIVAHCGHSQISLNDLRVFCSSIGVTTTQRPEYMCLVQKLKTRCNALRPLLNCNTLDTTLSGIESLGKQSLQHLSIQHDLDVNTQHDADSLKTDIVDHVTSGGCQASSSSLCMSIGDEYQENHDGAQGDLETYVLQLAAKKANLGKKPLRRVLTSRKVEFNDDDSIGELRRRLRSHITQVRKGKQSEWSRKQHAEAESKRNHRLNEIREEWPQPVSMEAKEDCVRNFRTATSSDTLRQFTCACCAESVNLS